MNNPDHQLILIVQILRKFTPLLFQPQPFLFYGFSFAIIVTSLMNIKLNIMKRVLLTFLSFIVILSTVNAQKGINFSRKYATGGKMLMCVDSLAKNVFYAIGFQNLPRTAFNFLPEVNNISIQVYFRKADSVQNYRYTILENNTPIIVNKTIDMAKLKDEDVGEDEVFRTTTFGIFAMKDKIITIIMYDIQKPQDVYKTIFYGKPIPRAKILGFSKLFRTDKGFDYSWIMDPKDKTALTFTERMMK